MIKEDSVCPCMSMIKYNVSYRILVSAALVIGLVSAGVACDGTAVTFDDTKELRQSSTGPDGVDSGSGSDGVDSGSASVPSSGPGVIVATGDGCQAVKLFSSPLGDSGAVSYTTSLVDGATSIMESLGDKFFRVTCLDGDTELLRVTFGPYVGNKNYGISVGDLVLHGQPSDRACMLSLSSVHPAIRGFVSCDNEPYSDGNIFAQSGAPIGLAVFDVVPH